MKNTFAQGPLLSTSGDVCRVPLRTSGDVFRVPHWALSTSGDVCRAPYWALSTSGDVCSVPYWALRTAADLCRVPYWAPPCRRLQGPILSTAGGAGLTRQTFPHSHPKHVMQCAVEMLLLSHFLSLIQSPLFSWVIKVLQVHIIYIFNGILTSSLNSDWYGWASS